MNGFGRHVFWSDLFMKLSRISLSPVPDPAVEVSAGFWFHMRAGARVIRIFVSNDALTGMAEVVELRREHFAACRRRFESQACERYAAGLVEPDGIIRF